MFHNTTTIWRQEEVNDFSRREKRLVFGFFGSLKDSFKTIGRGVLKSGAYAKRASKSWPMRLLLSPITKVHEYTAKGAWWAYDKVTWTGNMAKEAAKGVVSTKNSIGRGFFDLAFAPIEAVKRLFVNNFRDVIKGVFRTPYNVAKDIASVPYYLTRSLFRTPYRFLTHPVKTIIGMKNSVVGAAKKVREKTASVLDDVTGFHFVKLAKRTRSGVKDLLKKPARVIARPFKSVFRTPYEVARNTGHAAMAYPEAVKKWAFGMRDGVKRILGSPNAATGIMSERRQAHEMEMKAIESPA